nr:zinc knuckle CX2CX4HX4C [Tanacetum cinerariifolium]
LYNRYILFNGIFIRKDVLACGSNSDILGYQRRLLNVPFEAWNVKGISAISSRLERPIKIDQMIAEMCKVGSGRLGFARVLVEINAEKPFLDSVEINCLRYSEEMLETLQKAKLELLRI